MGELFLFGLKMIENITVIKTEDELVEYYKYIDNVPVGYSFSNNRLTAIMGSRYLTVNFIDNVY